MTNDPRGKPFQGFQSLVDMFQVMDPAEREKLLAGVAQKDPKLAQSLRDSLFRMEDLLRVEAGATLQGLVRDVDTATWALALKNMPEELGAHIAAQMPRRRAEELAEFRAALPPMPLSKVREAQKKVTDRAQALGIRPGQGG
jgi:flagellar motor switch protein FliG